MPGPGQREICKCPTLGTEKVGKCPAVAPGGGGGGGGAGEREARRGWNWLMHYSRELFLFSWYMVFGIQVVQ